MADLISLAQYLGKRTLILGEVNTGKTSLCKAILEEMCRQGMSGKIAIIDLAPEIPNSLTLNRSIKRVGGKLLPPEGEDIIYLSTPLVPPRLSSKGAAESFQKAQENAAKILELFERYSLLTRNILFINDISLFLQAGSAATLVGFVSKAETVVANGYYGEKLGSSPLSQRERQEIDALKKDFHEIVFTKI